MRPRGSSAALSFRMVSMPTGPTSSCSSCRLPSPMPCSPVHVPWSASARLGENRKDSQRGALPLPSAPPAPPRPGLCSCRPSWYAKASALQIISVSSGSTIRRQWKLPSPTCPTMNPGGPENRAAALSPALAPCPPLPHPNSGQVEPVIPKAFRSSLVCTRISGSREMGTQTSVV